MSNFFSDRENGPVNRNSEIINDRLWAGLRSLIEIRIQDGSLGLRFPKACSDQGGQPYGTDDERFAATLNAEVPNAVWPMSPCDLPTVPTALDILEFCAQSIGIPRRGRYHDYYGHTHIADWDREAGLEAFVADVNRLFARNGVAFELTPDGVAQRLLPKHIAAPILSAVFKTGDEESDRLLETARRCFLAPKTTDRRDGLEKLWDAFERIKTLEDPDKKIGAQLLLDKAARSGSLFRQSLDQEAQALTYLGNAHRIRHSEVTQEPLETNFQLDFLFNRLFAFIHLVLSASGRIA